MRRWTESPTGAHLLEEQRFDGETWEGYIIAMVVLRDDGWYYSLVAENGIYGPFTSLSAVKQACEEGRKALEVEIAIKDQQ